MTDPDCASGTDRVFAAVQLAGLPHEAIINVQGDMPFVEPETIIKTAKACLEQDFDITTAASRICAAEAQSSSTAKVVFDKNNKALYFSRSMIPHGSQDYWGHIGIYAFKSKALQQFCQLPISDIETIEKLEQLRALHNAMTIGVCIVDSMPISIDVEEDLVRARAFYSQ